MSEPKSLEGNQMNTSLSIISASSLPTLTQADKNNIFGKLYSELDGFTPDVSSKKGREEIASKARKVAVAKMDMVRLSQTLKEDHQKIIKAINAEVKVVEDKFDELRDRVRQPLTDFENAEAARVKAHEDGVAAIRDMVMFDADPSSAEVEQRISDLHALPKRDWQEFAQRAADAFSAADERLHGKLAQARYREAEEAEAQRQAAEEAERQRIEAERQRRAREAEIARQAAEQARLEAERRAAEAAAVERQRVEQERLAAEKAAQDERDRVQREAQEAEERAAKAERDRIAAEKRAQEAAEKAERDRIDAHNRAEAEKRAAVEAERQRIEAERVRAENEAAERERNRAYKAKIMGEAKAALMERCGISEEDAVKVVRAIVAGHVPHTVVRF